MSARGSMDSLQRLAPVSDTEAAAVFGFAGREELLEGVTRLPFGRPRRLRPATRRLRLVLAFAALAVAAIATAATWAIAVASVRAAATSLGSSESARFTSNSRAYQINAVTDNSLRCASIYETGGGPIFVTVRGPSG